MAQQMAATEHVLERTEEDLRVLTLAQLRVTDAGLGQLAGLPPLGRINVASTPVTDAGVAQLEQALAGLHVTRWLRQRASSSARRDRIPLWPTGPSKPASTCSARASSPRTPAADLPKVVITLRVMDPTSWSEIAVLAARPSA